MCEWTFKVMVPSGNGYSDPTAMLRVVQHFRELKIAAEFKSKDGIPINEDDEYTMVVKDNRSADLAMQIVGSHYGLIAYPV
jgi:hypothetical protein